MAAKRLAKDLPRKETAATADANRHMVLEASAGTGKTHSLIDRVVQLLTVDGSTLDQILLVTFTEKATGELKARLRERLEKLAGDASEHRAKARSALDIFDQSAIFTIHGFCQRVLQEHAFEHRQEFGAELVHDHELAEPALREVQRQVWQREYGDQLTEVLEQAGFSGGNWEVRVCSLATFFRPTSNSYLLPTPTTDLLARVNAIDDELRAEWAECRQMAEVENQNTADEHRWWQGYGNLNFRKDWRDMWRERGLRPILDWLHAPGSNAQPRLAFDELVSRCKKAGPFEKHGFSFLVIKAISTKQACETEIPKECPNLEELLGILDKRRLALASEGLEHLLAARTVVQVQEQLQQWKRERGQQSYEDMLTRVDVALDPQKNPGADRMAQALRRRYRVAIVDEFQDTDPLQWRIFRRVFVEAGASHRLIVVGDPKQAIYGFRGADLNAYQGAVQELKNKHKADSVPLDVNWRSDPCLLQVLNQLFEFGGWFCDSGIQYKRVNWPADSERPTRLLLPDQSGRASLTLVKFDNPEKMTIVRRQMARFIAAEIAQLLRSKDGPLLKFKDRHGAERRLEAGDVCILIARRKEARPVEEELRKNGLPYTFYKQTGLWQSDEAAELAYLLRAMARPEDRQAVPKALLTRFFRLSAAQLAQVEDLPANHPAKVLLEKWREYAGSRRWAALFHSILHETGLLLSEARQSDADRRRANLLHITQTLEQRAYGRDLDLCSLVEHLEARIRDEGSEEGLQPVETDRSKVRIITIHASKGLEFPVVFLAGGFTTGNQPDFLRYHDAEGRLVLDLRVKDEDAKERHKQECRKEEERLYYVALTRAMFKLYVPWVVDGPKSAGPVVTLLAPAILESKLESLDSNLLSVADGNNAPQTGGVARGEVTASFPVPTEPVHPPEELFPRFPGDIAFRRTRISSFSSLHRQALAEGPVYLHNAVREDDEPAAGAVETEPFRGPVFGEMLHEILEEIDFAEVGAASAPERLPQACLDLIENARLRHWAKLPVRVAGDTSLVTRCAEELARLTWNALHTPLPDLGPLRQIPRADRLHEVEFHYPTTSAVSPPPDIRGEQGFLTGFIDLVVRKNGCFYLIDWKSNWLPAYSPKDLDRSMVECDYIRQYRIYLQALDRWLKRRVTGFDWGRDLAGVFYLYVRGLSARQPQMGVYHHHPELMDFDLATVL